MFIQKQLYFVSLVVMLLILQPLAAMACATCGCSELCPLCMVKEVDSSTKDRSKVSPLGESMWGSIILKMAFQKDPQLQKLTRHLKGANALTSAAMYTAVSGTLGQNIVSLAVLNPDQGNDSYLPGSIGLGCSSLMTVAFDASILFNWRLSKKIKARQLAIEKHVYSIVDHLEYSQASCPDAQKELTEIIGPQGAADLIKMWQLGHNQLASTGIKTGLLENQNEQTAPALKETMPQPSKNGFSLPRIESKVETIKIVNSNLDG
jgi:hypothetical protein